MVDGKVCPLRPSDVQKWHRANVKWLKAQIQLAQSQKVFLVVLTHHAPLLAALPPHRRTTWHASGYATDLTSLFGGNILVWGYGHTHITFDKTYNQTRVISNPLGYKSQRLLEQGLFKPNMTIDIDPQSRGFSPR